MYCTKFPDKVSCRKHYCTDQDERQGNEEQVGAPGRSNVRPGFGIPRLLSSNKFVGACGRPDRLLPPSLSLSASKTLLPRPALAGLDSVYLERTRAALSFSLAVSGDFFGAVLCTWAEVFSVPFTSGWTADSGGWLMVVAVSAVTESVVLGSTAALSLSVAEGIVSCRSCLVELLGFGYNRNGGSTKFVFWIENFAHTGCRLDLPEDIEVCPSFTCKK